MPSLNPQHWRGVAIMKLMVLAWALLASTGHAAGPQRLHPSSRSSGITSTNVARQRLQSATTTKTQLPPRFNVNHPSRGGSSPVNTKKLANLKERALSAAVMLGGLVLWIDTFREKGMILLVLIIQVGLYREGTNVVLPNLDLHVGPNKRADNRQPTSSVRCWWYMAYELALVGPRLLSTKRDGSPLLSASSIYLCAFGMIALGIVSFVVTLNNSIAFSYEFQLAVQELASYHLAIALVVVPSSFWIAIIQDYGMKWVLYSLYLVMINDTMAYVFGASFGKHPLLPTISPKKTWEGFLGALVSTMAMSIVLWKQLNFVGVAAGTGTRHALLIAAYCSLIAPFGGFLASIVKRAYGKKDFSNMIAGHGGFVDRLDCQLITAPFIYLYLSRFVRPWKH